MRIRFHRFMTFSGIAWLGFGAGICDAAADVTLPINPLATYLRTNNDSGSLPASAISLSNLGFAPGDSMRLERLGGFRVRLGGTENEGSGMIGVFSSSSTILASNLVRRIPDAIDAGPDVITPATYFGSLTTDIPEDFLIASTGGVSTVTVTVPAGAAFVFIVAADQLYYDNADQDNNFRIVISRGCPADFNNDGFLDFFDYDEFVNCFESGTCEPGRTADFNGDGFVDFFDYDDFVSAFESGC